MRKASPSSSSLNTAAFVGTVAVEANTEEVGDTMVRLDMLKVRGMFGEAVRGEFLDAEERLSNDSKTITREKAFILLFLGIVM